MNMVATTATRGASAGKLRGLPVVLLCLLSHCGTPLRNSATQTADALAVVANAGGQAVLEGYCAAQMSAIGRSGTLETGSGGEQHCVEHGERAGTPATEVERSSLAQTRARWASLIAAHDAMRRTHDGLRRALASGQDGIPLALVGLTWTYGVVAQQAHAFGIELPHPAGDGGAR